jgi:hypothetical protein
MIALLREAYVRSWRFVRACPAIIALVIAAEFGQHIAEIGLGMYDSIDQARAVADAPLRLITGHLKILSLILLGYGVPRFLGYGNPGAAMRLDPRAVRLFVPVLALDLFWVIVGLDGGSLLRLAGLDAALAARIIPLLSGVGFVLGLFLVPWSVAAPLGNAAIGPIRSARISWRHLPFVLIFGLVPALPLMALHYGLFFGVVGLPRAIVWPAALLDAVVVGYLGALLATTSFVIARRITERNGIALLPER